MPVIKTPLGDIRGLGYKNGLTFRGIRFAQPPVAALRFQPPQPVTAWDDVYDGTEFGPSAPQPEMPVAEDSLQLPKEPTDEDCLFLNVYTPAADDKRRPVLFWIHGGGYVVGSGRAYDGSVFVEEHDVVVVTINYRMGALGFMHVGHLDPALSSSVNNGILDQICALEWTRDNIAAFGGDPDNVLIFGESAGATSTAMLLACPKAEGLFHKAVVHSPHVDLITVEEGGAEFTNRCIKRLGGDPDVNGMATLREATADELNALVFPDFNDHEAFQPPALSIRTAANVTFSPAIDGVLIPGPVAEAIKSKGAGNVPIIGGGCRHEGTLFPTALGFKPDGSDFTEAEARAMFTAAGVNAEQAFSAYEGFAPGSTAHEKLVYGLTDTMFRNSMVRILDALADSGVPCWSWMCVWETDMAKLRSTHAMDLMFLWDWAKADIPGMRAFAGTDAPLDLGRTMREYWVRFAQTGIPAADNQPQWPEYDTTDRSVLLLDGELSVVGDFDGEIRKVWF
jgi:para-nitrobenzyl esterase